MGKAYFGGRVLTPLRSSRSVHLAAFLGFARLRPFRNLPRLNRISRESHHLGCRREVPCSEPGWAGLEQPRRAAPEDFARARQTSPAPSRWVVGPLWKEHQAPGAEYRNFKRSFATDPSGMRPLGCGGHQHPPSRSCGLPALSGWAMVGQTCPYPSLYKSSFWFLVQRPC